MMTDQEEEESCRSSGVDSDFACSGPHAKSLASNSSRWSLGCKSSENFRIQRRLKALAESLTFPWWQVFETAASHSLFFRPYSS